MKPSNETGKLERAKARVNVLKGFYQHLTAYIIVNSILLLFSGKITFVLLSERALGNPEFLERINWSIWGTPIIWGVGLLIHAIVVFAFNPFKKWEERQIQKYMDEDTDVMG
ncbi:MAG: 2TM domain-containing protein [Bacteroidota bacterium]